MIHYNANEEPFAGLTNWSNEFPFDIQGVKYASVNHYIFCKMTNETSNSILLSTQSDIDLRRKFNDISSDLYLTYSKQIMMEGARLQFLQNKAFRQYFLERPHFYYYYIHDDVLWGINASGYGFNLIGQVYSRLTATNHSSFYQLKENVIYTIYLANVLLVHHLQKGNDVAKYIGKPMTQIVEELRPLYQDVLFLDSSIVFDNYHNDTYYQNIQYEIDYPWNLAGFVRKQYAHQLNFYLRTRFNEYMIGKYFAHVLKTRFKDVIDATQMDLYVRQQMSRLTEQKFQDLSDILFNLYNNPSTNTRVLTFLDKDAIQHLYDIETQFLTSNEIFSASRYVPFLYNNKVGKSIYIYNSTNMTNLQPYTTAVSPVMAHSFTTEGKEFEDLVLYIYVKLATRFTNLSLERAHNLLVNCEGLEDCQKVLENAIRMYKVVLMKKGMSIKFETNMFAKYLLYNSHDAGYNVVVQDPDPVFEQNIPKFLTELRKELTEPYFPISNVLVGHNLPLQDRIRYRLEDFLNVFEAYCIYTNKNKIEEEDYAYLQDHLFRNPTKPKKTRTMSPEFYNYFEAKCTAGVIDKLWAFFCTYSLLVSEQPLEQAAAQPLSSVASIVSYFVKTFYKEGEESKFLEFVMSVTTGRKGTSLLVSSMTYYNREIERQLQNFLEVNSYDTTFMVNVMGVIASVEKQISPVRQQYLSYWALQVHSPPYASNLLSRISGTALIRKAVSEIRRDKRMRTKTRKEQERMSGEEDDERNENGEIDPQEEEEEEQLEMQEMYRELGIEDDDDDDGMDQDDGDGFDGDMDNEFGED